MLKQMKQKKWLIAAVVLFVLAGATVAYVVFSRLQKKEAAEFYQEAARAGEQQESETELPKLEESKSAGEPAENKPVIPVDIRKLRETMPDIYAWIRIPGTDIDYPVVQREDDNAYYIKRTPDGKSSAGGSIFSEIYNKKDFTDPNTVLYGHNMKDGSMFGQLHRYEDRSFFDENRTVYIYTEENILQYEIFAAYLYDDRHILQSYDFFDPQVFTQYLREIYAIRDMRSYVDRSTEVTEESRLLTLSTCHGLGNKYRYIVQAVKCEENP